MCPLLEGLFDGIAVYRHRLKGTDASLNIKNRYDAITGRLVPLDIEIQISEKFTSSKVITKHLGGEFVILHTMGISTPPPIREQTVTQPDDRIGGSIKATDPK